MTLKRSHPRAPPTLVSSAPTASAPASIAIGHVQLRDLIVCPAERGVLWYISDRSIIEQDIISSDCRQRTLAFLTFTPVTLAALPLPFLSSSDKKVILLAAGGQDAELFLALYSYRHRGARNSKYATKERAAGSIAEGRENERGDERAEESMEEEEDVAGHSTPIWQHASSLVGSINNNVLLYLPPTDPDHVLDDHDMDSEQPECREELTRPIPRLVVSNNDCTVKFFDVSIARGGLRRTPSQSSQSRIMDARYWRRAARGGPEGGGWGERSAERIVRYERVGCLRLPVPVNHTSISPDGSTVLSCGDSSTIYLHRILPMRDGTTLLFEPLARYDIPSPSVYPSFPPPSPHRSQHVLDAAHPSLSTYLPFAFVDGAWVVASSYPYNGADGADGAAVPPPACFATAWSADGMKFAAASQEGVVRVWDVRSGEPLEDAGWDTGRERAEYSELESKSDLGGDRLEGLGGRSRIESAWLEQASAAPQWAVRALKFARNSSGREVLAFTEHASLLHVIDADTFNTHDVLRIPHVQPGVPRSESYPSLSSSPPYLSYPPHADSTGASANSSAGRLDDAGTAHHMHPYSDRPELRNVPPRMPRRRSAHVFNSTSPPVRVSGTAGSEPTTSRLVAPGMPPRVLSPSRPFTRSPEEITSILLRPRDTAGTNSASATMSIITSTSRSGSGSRPSAPSSSSARLPAQRDRIRHALARALMREEWENRRGSESGGERGEERERDGERVRDNAQMEEDIAFYARRNRRVREDVDMDRDHDEGGSSDDGGGIVVIPSFANARSEEDVRSVLAAHGIASISSGSGSATATANLQVPAPQRPGAPPPSAGGSGTSSSANADTTARQHSSNRARTEQQAYHVVGEYLMDVDEDVVDALSISESDFECMLEDAVAGASAQLASAAEAPASSSTATNTSSSHSSRPHSSPPTPADHPEGTPNPSSAPSLPMPAAPSSPPTPYPAHALPPCRELIESTDRLDIAGVAFDPSGSYMYVATVDGITEWAVQGAEQRWWSAGGWL